MPTQWLQDKLENGEVITEEDVRRIVRQFAGSAGARRETHVLDFKAELQHGKEGRCKLTKSLVEFANADGGILLYGIGDDGQRLGCPRSLLDRLEPTKVQDILNNYIGNPALRINTVSTNWYRNLYVAIAVYPSNLPIVFERDGDYTRKYPDGRQEQKKEFYAGTISVRDGSRSTRAQQRHVNRLVQRAADQRTQQLVRRFEKVAYLPDDFDLVAGKAGSGQALRLVSHREGVPVRIVEDDDEEALRIEEFLTDEPFSQLDSEIMSQIRAYRTDPHYRIGARVAGRWYLYRHECNVLEQAAELALRSTIRRYGFPMYWASLLEEDRLRELVIELIENPDWPDVQQLPYLVGAFFWDERATLLDRIVSEIGYNSVKASAIKLKDMDWEFFAYRSKIAITSAEIPGFEDGETVYLPEVYADRERARAAFDRLVTAFVNDRAGSQLRAVARQLDLVLHAMRSDAGG